MPTAVPRSARARRRARPLARLLAPLAVVLLVAGCSNGSSAGDDLPPVPESEFVDETGRKAVTVTALDNEFDPRYVTVTEGTKVTFVNDGRNPHNVLAAEQGAFRDVPTEDFAPGASATITFDSPGTYPYYCSLHGTASRGMNGRIVVEEK